MAQSGRRGTPWKFTTTRPVAISQIPAPEASDEAIAVPSAAPMAPNAGIGPHPRIRIMFRPMLSPMIHIPMRSPVFASPAARSAPAIMK